MKKNLLYFFLLSLTLSCNSEVFRIESEPSITEEDVKCISLLPDHVSVELTGKANKSFLQYTSANIGKELEVTICDVKANPVIRQGIESPFAASINSSQFECLDKSSLKKCKQDVTTTSPTEPELQECRKFVETVLKPAVTNIETSQEHGNRFVKDEKEALKFLQLYDSSKLGINLTLENGRKDISDCAFYNSKAYNEKYCDESVFTNFDFLRGLIYGMKHYGWKKSTVDLAGQKIREYLKANAREGLPLLNLTMAFHIFNYLVTEVPQEGINPNDVSRAMAEIEKVVDSYRKGMKVIHEDKNCIKVQAQMKEERDRAAPFAKRLSELLNTYKG